MTGLHHAERGTMLRKLALLAPLASLFLAAGDARAIGFDEHGSGTDPNDWDAPKVAPSTACHTLMLYAAVAAPGDTTVDKYRFSGECTFNVAPQGKRAVMKTVPVLVDAEWHPKLKRASERIVVKHPDLGVELSTWATCASDPFVAPNVACIDKGMGANRFEMFISREDAPFAKNRANASQVAAANAAVGANAAKIWENPTISRIRPIGAQAVGARTPIWIDVAGGAGMCPMEIDFGDGTKEKLIVWAQKPFSHVLEHAFTKPGALWVKARALPGCSGEGTVVAIVK